MTNKNYTIFLHRYTAVYRGIRYDISENDVLTRKHQLFLSEFQASMLQLNGHEIPEYENFVKKYRPLLGPKIQGYLHAGG